MGEVASALGKPAPNPFSPGFGQLPSMLVGRDDLLAEIGSGLVTGPRDIRYTSLFMGVRGSGKTVAVTELEDRAASDGWVILSLDASSKGILERIQDELGALPERYPELDLGKLGGEMTVERTKGVDIGGFKGGVAETVSLSRGRAMGLRWQLTYLAEQAQRRDTSVLLTVDELHAIDREEGRRLSNDLQHITRRRSELPLAFLGAGLSEMKYTLLQDKKMTFFRRCEQYDMPPLTEADVAKGLLHPIQDFGGEITDDALRLAVENIGTLPYKLQLVGHTAWTIADAPERVIDARAVNKAVELAQKSFDEKVSEPAFYDLSDSERRFLKGLADLGWAGKVADIAVRSGQNVETARGIGRRLTISGYLQNDSGIVRLTELVPKRIITQELGESLEGADESQPISVTPMPSDPSPSSKGTDRCRKWMPRKQAYCILVAGHSGRCRSQ
ncbi:MAG: ATP-binding protein [bacterium]|nr:ATP-binding protein [bacterium]